MQWSHLLQLVCCLFGWLVKGHRRILHWFVRCPTLPFWLFCGHGIALVLWAWCLPVNLVWFVLAPEFFVGCVDLVVDRWFCYLMEASRALDLPLLRYSLIGTPLRSAVLYCLGWTYSMPWVSMKLLVSTLFRGYRLWSVRSPWYLSSRMLIRTRWMRCGSK